MDPNRTISQNGPETEHNRFKNGPQQYVSSSWCFLFSLGYSLLFDFIRQRSVAAGPLRRRLRVGRLRHVAMYVTNPCVPRSVCRIR